VFWWSITPQRWDPSAVSREGNLPCDEGRSPSDPLRENLTPRVGSLPPTRGGIYLSVASERWRRWNNLLSTSRDRVTGPTNPAIPWSEKTKVPQFVDGLAAFISIISILFDVLNLCVNFIGGYKKGFTKGPITQISNMLYIYFHSTSVF
jgi:hypothetical protein